MFQFEYKVAFYYRNISQQVTAQSVHRMTVVNFRAIYKYIFNQWHTAHVVH